MLYVRTTFVCVCVVYAQVSEGNASYFETQADLLQQQLKEEKLLRGPKWLYLLHKDNRQSPLTPFPW